MASPQAVMALNFTMHTLALCCTVLRLWVARRRGIITPRVIICQSLVFAVCFTEFASSSLSGVILHNEIKFQKEFDPETVAKMIFSRENLYVRLNTTQPS